MQGLGTGLMGLLPVLPVAYVAVAALAFLLADHVLFQPPPPSYEQEAAGVTRVAVGDGDSIALVHLPNPAARFTILFSHGNAEDLGDMLPLLKALQGFGFAVVGYDYRGYGRSGGGRPTARKAAQDAEAAYRFAVRALGVSPTRLILHGRSLGSGPAVLLARRHDVGGLILESAFTSPYRVLTGVGILPFDRFPNLAGIRDVRCPVLVIHGTRDGVIRVSHGRRLFAAATSPRQSLWVEGAGHNDLFDVAGPQYEAALKRFAAELDRVSSDTR